MYKNSFYRLMIVTALAMASNTTNTMMIEWCRKKEQKPEREFKTASDIPRVTKFDCGGLGFIAGCAQQGFCVSQLFSTSRTEPTPLAPFAGLFMQWPGSALLAFCMYGYCKGVVDGLRTQTDTAIGMVFNHVHPQTFCDEFHERDLRRKEFIADYRKMRAGKTALDPAVVAAHNAVLECCIKRRSFFRGYGYGAALGFPAAMMLLACAHSTQK